MCLAGVLASVAVSRGAVDATPTVTETTTLATTADTTTTTVAPPPLTSSTATTTPAPPAPAAPAAPPTTAVTTTSSSRTGPRPAARPARRCSVVAAAGLRLPRRPVLPIRLLSPGAGGRVVEQRRLVFPSGGGIIRIGSLALRAGECRQALRLRSLSLFGGVITAEAVAIQLGRNGGVSTSVRGLRVRGSLLARAVRRVRLGRWGVLVVRRRSAALLIRLVKRHAGWPAGTTVVVAFAAAPAATLRRSTLRFGHAAPGLPGRPRRRQRARPHRPLNVTPPLGARRYVFPIVGSATFGDSYGAYRADVSGNWHHGDDIFAAVGTPVVAVASGALNRVGWEGIGGWRLWLRDRRGNQFYYAHLSGYSPQALRTRQVQVGDVIAFVGNTGDAFTTPPHLHFEIHPRQLLSLHYDGAVDPTAYLERWRHLERVPVPKPTLPRLPRGAEGREARYVFGQLLAARGLGRPPTSPAPAVRVQGHDRPAQPLRISPMPRPAAAAAWTSPRLTLISLAAGLLLTILAAGMGVRLRRRG